MTQQKSLIFVTNDEDFMDFANYNGFDKIILLRTGNKAWFISDLLTQRKVDIESFYNSKETGLLK
jgi:predicted nuclease of predicted toxin-antitoxin system